LSPGVFSSPPTPHLLFFFWWDWVQTQAFTHTCNAGALPLEPHLQSPASFFNKWA
jgi:hypothetical protein